MPYKSKAQARAIHAKADRGEIPKKVATEFDAATKAADGFAKLPAKAPPPPFKKKKRR
jgi:hypothetical protein